MDRTSIIILVVCVIGLLAWPPLVENLYPPPPPSESETSAPDGSTATNDATAQPAPSESQPTPTRETPTIGPVDSVTIDPERPDERLHTLENDLARFVFTSHGGGLKRIELKLYDRVISCSDDSEDEEGVSNPVILNQNSLYPILALEASSGIDGSSVYDITVDENDPNSISLKRAQPETGLTFHNRFTIGADYSIDAVTQIKNNGDSALNIPRRNRSIGLIAPTDKDEAEYFLTLYHSDGQKATKKRIGWFKNRALGCVPGQPRSLYTASGDIRWAGAASQFFAIIAEPVGAADPNLRIESLARNVPYYSDPVNASDQRQNLTGFQTSLNHSTTSIAPGEFFQTRYDIYAGPKEYSRLSKLDLNKEDVMNFGYVGIFSKALLLAMNGIHALGASYGWSIIIITVIIKLLFWPLTATSAKSMKRMSALQPQMKEIQEKYKEDPKKMNEKMMRFMKENKVNPMGGCWPILLQMPVFIGFFFMIKSAIELRGASFLWACDLSRPDTVLTIPGLEFPINPMPILMAITMLLQIRSTPVAPGMDPTQATIMRYMPLIFVVVLYNYSSGLTLYWTVQNILSVIQTRITNAKTDTTPAEPKKPLPNPGSSGKKARTRVKPRKR